MKFLLTPRIARSVGRLPQLEAVEDSQRVLSGDHVGEPRSPVCHVVREQRGVVAGHAVRGRPDRRKLSHRKRPPHRARLTQETARCPAKIRMVAEITGRSLELHRFQIVVIPGNEISEITPAAVVRHVPNRWACERTVRTAPLSPSTSNSGGPSGGVAAWWHCRARRLRRCRASARPQ